MTARLLVLLAVALVSGGVGAQAPVEIPVERGGVGLADALGAAVRQSPDVALAGEGVAVERAALRAASAAFEPQLYGSAGGGRVATPLSSLQRATPDVGTAGRGVQQYEVGVRRRFRSGLEVTPAVQMTRTAADGADALVETTAGLALAYPVFGGRARSVDVAAEAAAGQRVTAAGLDRARAEEVAAAEAAFAYWDYVGAERVRAALVVSEGRAARLLAETEALVAADEQPAADLVPLRADLARRRAARLGADQGVFDARQRLGLAMGGTAEDAAALGAPRDGLPAVPSRVDADEAALMARALEARADVRAAGLRTQAVGRELGALRADMRPSVDVVVDAGYTALSEGTAGPHQYLPLGIGATRGGRVGVTLRVNRLGSGAARASVERARAVRTRAEIARDDLARRVRADVAAAVAGLRSGAAEVAQTRAAVGLYEEAVENERRRLRLGMGTLFDVQIVEERLATARTQAVQSEVRYAQALVRLHAAVGSLRAGDAAGTAGALRGLPALDDSTGR